MGKETVSVHRDVIEHFRRDFMAVEVNEAARRQFGAMCDQALRAEQAERQCDEAAAQIQAEYDHAQRYKRQRDELREALERLVSDVPAEFLRGAPTVATDFLTGAVIPNSEGTRTWPRFVKAVEQARAALGEKP